MILFATGLCSMAMEVIWIRCFSTLLGSLVYSFVLLLASYLISNWLGACWYRLDAMSNKTLSQQKLIAAAAICACFPLLADNPQFVSWLLLKIEWNFLVATVALLSIMPFSFVLGYLTPSLVDDFSQGIPREAGKAYAINISGCILGPLIAGYLFLPLVGGSNSLVVFILPLLYFLVSNSGKARVKIAQQIIAVICAAILIISSFSITWEEGGKINTPRNYRIAQIHRDYAATTIAGMSGGLKFLRVNGEEMTSLSQDTKFMAHLPLVFHTDYPKSILVICFGMGTSFRSAATWDSKVTVVELLPSVINSFNYFHADANSVLTNPNNHVIIDDGRRFLNRVTEKFDVVIVDPPPPLETSASSLLYSKEFFEAVKKHLAPGGILMEWYGFPHGEQDCLHALARSIVQEFHYVKIYKALDEPLIAGYFILCSENPIKKPTAEKFFNRLPEKAKYDLMESLQSEVETQHPLLESLNLAYNNRIQQVKAQVNQILSDEIKPDNFLVPNPSIVITDDHPFNEYYFLRRLLQKNVYVNSNIN
jgi:spermidine synthase